MVEWLTLRMIQVRMRIPAIQDADNCEEMKLGIVTDEVMALDPGNHWQ